MTPPALIYDSLRRACLRRSWRATATTTRRFDSSSNNSDSNNNHNNTSTTTAASKINIPTTAADETTTNANTNTNTNIHTNTRVFSTTTKNNGTTTYSRHKTVPTNHDDDDHLKELMGQPLQNAAGPLWGPDIVDDDDHEDEGSSYIPEVSLYAGEGGVSSSGRKRVLILCTGGTLTMAPDPNQGGSLAPVEGAISKYMKEMTELHQPGMPDYTLHEYSPFRDSSDLGPADWATLAQDIKANYLHFDGFVILTGTDTMAYCATALSFMLENLGKPVVFTGSQIPLSEPYNDARRNLIMAMIFASRETINEVSIFFHDRLLRANRATKVNTHRLLAFDSPNMDPLATIGITIDENEHLVLPPPKGALRVHTRMDTRLLTIRLVPGFDDQMIRQMIIEANDVEKKEQHQLKTLVLQLYGTGNIPSVKESFVQLLADATDKGIMVVASTQCFTGSVMMGHYATGRALEQAGVVSASDMTLEAIACKSAYLLGRNDLTTKEVGELLTVSLRGEMTPTQALSPPPLSSAFQRGIRKGKTYF
jgi:L-asparaginase